jgi:hypothetical protein
MSRIVPALIAVSLTAACAPMSDGVDPDAGPDSDTPDAAQPDSGAPTTVRDAGAPDAGQCSMVSGGGEFDSCTDSTHCRCPLSCVHDPALSPLVGSAVCESPCQTSLDCQNLNAFCHDGFCQLSACGPSQGNTDAACTNGDGLPGSCVTAVLRAGGFAAYWGCSVAGTATGACNPVTISRANPASLCKAGFICDANNGYDHCVELCVPNSSTCAGDTACNAQDVAGRLGICGP